MRVGGDKPAFLIPEVEVKTAASTTSSWDRTCPACDAILLVTGSFALK